MFDLIYPIRRESSSSHQIRRPSNWWLTSHLISRQDTMPQASFQTRQIATWSFLRLTLACYRLPDFWQWITFFPIQLSLNISNESFPWISPMKFSNESFKWISPMNLSNESLRLECLSHESCKENPETGFCSVASKRCFAFRRLQSKHFRF